MTTIAERLYAQAKIVPLKPQNRVKTITKLEDGSLRAEQHSGSAFTLSKEDKLLQAFCVWTVLNPDAQP